LEDASIRTERASYMESMVNSRPPTDERAWLLRPSVPRRFASNSWPLQGMLWMLTYLQMLDVFGYIAIH
jgi:hypothetical protein